MSKDSCFVSPLYFSQKSEDLFSLSSKFFLFNIFFFFKFQIRLLIEKVCDQPESGGAGERERVVEFSSPTWQVSGQWSVLGAGPGQSLGLTGAHHDQLGGFKTFQWFQTTLQNGENFTPGRKYYLNQIIRQERFWPFLNLVSTPPRLSDVLMCQESNFREELLVWIVKIQIMKTLRG